MKNKAKNKKFKGKKVGHSFSSKRLTRFAGLGPIMKFIDRIKLAKELDENFPTIAYNATKFSITQLMLAVVLASMSGVCHLTGIANFTNDPLIQALLGLKNSLNKDVISVRFKELGQRGARLLEELNGRRIQRQLEKAKLKSITLDGDSTVKTVYGNQQGAAKGYNPFKKGAKSYHPILVFASECKLVFNTWFRTGSAYTSNGIVELLKQTSCYLPGNITKVFFRADSGFFDGKLFDFLESRTWDYLIKVKLKGLAELLEKQRWEYLESHQGYWVCELTYKTNNWENARTFKAIRWIKEYKPKEYFGQIELVPIYAYACYCTNLDLDPWSTHEKYNERSTSETWIEQVKSQLYAGMTLTDDFWANDILWQLSVLAYNLSIMLRLRHKKLFRQEHQTFREWFVNVPAEIKGLHHKPELHIYKYYSHRKSWDAFAGLLAA